MRAETLRTFSLHALFLCVVLGLWEWGARAGWVDPSFMGSPLGIIQFTLENLTNVEGGPLGVLTELVNGLTQGRSERLLGAKDKRLKRGRQLDERRQVHDLSC